MRRLCGEGIDVSFGKSLSEISYEDDRVIAHFYDGSTVQGDLLIGADGVRSIVREKLLGAEKAKATPCRGNFTTAIAKYPDAETALRVRSGDWEACIGYHPDGMCNMVASKFHSTFLQILLIFFQSLQRSRPKGSNNLGIQHCQFSVKRCTPRYGQRSSTTKCQAAM